MDSQSNQRQPDLSFSQTIAGLSSFSGQSNAANAIQVATTRFQRASLELRRAEAAVTAMRNDRLLVAAAASRGAPAAHLQNVSTGRLDAVSFGTLADRVIEEQAERVLDLQEVVRGEVAALDGQLKRLTTAFEDDLRRQFYRPVLNDLRRNSGSWNVRMGQVQTTTIRTNDRLPARVSPGQTAVLDRSVHPVLLQEGLQVAYGVAQEAQVLGQAGSLQAVGNAVAPGSAALLAQTGLVPVPGQRLGQLVESTERTTVSVGDEISLTPVIQPDGASVAFHFVYAHTPRRDSDGKTPVPAGVERHLVETNVNIPSLELQEVSRFRVTLDSDEQGKGIPLLQDIPVAGALFRPRRAAASTTQENIILVDAVIYPTAVAFAGKGWLAADAANLPVVRVAGHSACRASRTGRVHPVGVGNAASAAAGGQPCRTGRSSTRTAPPSLAPPFASAGARTPGNLRGHGLPPRGTVYLLTVRPFHPIGIRVARSTFAWHGLLVDRCRPSIHPSSQPASRRSAGCNSAGPPDHNSGDSSHDVLAALPATRYQQGVLTRLCLMGQLTLNSLAGAPA